MDPKEKLSVLSRFWRLVDLDRQTVINISLYAIFNGLIALSLPLGIQSIINLISGGQFSTSWFVMVAIVVLGILVSGILQVYQLTLAENLQQKIFAHSAFEFTYRLPKLKRDSVDKFYMPELVNRFFDTITLQKGMSKILLGFSRSLLQVFLGILLLSLYHPFFILYGLALLFILIIIFRYTAPLGMDSSLQESHYKYKLVHWMQEIARSFEAFKMAGHTTYPLERTNVLVGEYLNARKQHFKVLKLQFFVMVGFKVFITGGLLVLGGVLVLNQQMNIGQFVAAEIVIILLMNSVEKLITSFETIYDVMTGLEKIGFVSDLPMESDSGIKIDPESKGIDLKIKNVSYTNWNSDMVLKEINLHIKPGEKIAVTGVNRSGKSLLLQLVSGLFRDFKGSISYNNILLPNIDVMDLRNHMGENLGYNLIFEGTIWDNITLGRRDLTVGDVEEIVELVGLKGYIESMTKGYNEMVNSGGRMLPEGTSIKISLARAFINNPKLIVLEDPFDALDNETTDRIVEYINSDKLEATVIIATRRRKHLKLMNKIVMMKNGEISDVGNFDHLRTDADFSFMLK